MNTGVHEKHFDLFVETLPKKRKKVGKTLKNKYEANASFIKLTRRESYEFI